MRSHLSFQKITERFRMVLTIQHRTILNTFNRQSTKTKLDNILCIKFPSASVRKFWGYDPNLSSPNLCLQRFLLLAIGNKPLSLLLRTLNAFFVIASFCFVFWCDAFCWLLCKIKDLRHWFPPVSFSGKTQGFFFSAELFL